MDPTLNKTFGRFLWSSILIALSGCLGNVVDGVIVGNLVGADGVSAVNLSKPVIQFMFTISMVLAAGGSMLVGMNLGRKEYPRASHIYTLSVTTSLGVGFLLTLCGLLIPDVVTGWICRSEYLWQPAYDYTLYVLLGAPAYMLMWALGIHVGVDGSPRLSSLAVVIDNVVNLLLDIVFIRYFDWGIAGSSAATAVGHVVGILVLMRHFLYQDNHLHFSLSTFPLLPALGSIISQGAPLAVASISLTLLLVAANTIVVSTLGHTGIFAFAVCMNLLQVYNLFLSGTCRTLQSLGSIEVGKGSADGFRQIMRLSFQFITVAMAVTCLLVWIAPGVIAMLFGAESPEMVSETSHALRIFAPSFIPFCYIYTMMIVYKLYGHHKMALFISFALSLTVIPVLWLMARAAPGSLWYSYLIAYALEVVAIVVLHKTTHARFELVAPPNPTNKNNLSY